jgi:hypothetical protein
MGRRFGFAKRLVMKDLTSARLIKAKGILFLLLGLLSASLLFFGYPTPKTCVLLVIAIWSFCRFYYFAFYVIEHYVDPSYRFSGLLNGTHLSGNATTQEIAVSASVWPFFLNQVESKRYSACILATVCRIIESVRGRIGFPFNAFEIGA